MRSKEEAMYLGKYFNRYETDQRTASPANINLKAFNDTVVISDFHEWRKSILKSLEDQENNEDDTNAYNLKFLLHSITSIVMNLVDNDKSITAKDPRMEPAVNGSTMLMSKLIIANLTDFEFHILKEFTRLKMLENKRIPRTVKGTSDESECNLRFSFDSNGKDNAVRLLVKPAKKGEGMINIKNVVNDSSNNVTRSNVRECSFNIVYDSGERV